MNKALNLYRTGGGGGGGGGPPFGALGGGSGGGGGVVLPFMAYTGMYRWTGYSFCPLCPVQGI